VQLAAHLFDFERAPATPPDMARPARPTAPISEDPDDPIAMLFDVVEHDVEGMVDFARRNAPSVLPNLVRALRHPRETLAETVDAVRSIGRTVAPVTSVLSPIMEGRDLTSQFHVLDVPLKRLHDAAKAAGGTVNDGFLAGVTGGLRRYHEHHGAIADELRVAMPISLRTAADGPGGNHVTVMRFKVPVGTVDPAVRIRALHERAKEVRAERSLAYTGAIAGALNLLPTRVIGSMLKRVDFLASNVPGVPIPMYLLGSKVMNFYPFGPTMGSAVNITLMSYRDRCYFGVNVDTSAIPDPKVFMRCLKAGFAEVMQAEPKVPATIKR
jgi:diacylglycerol O-acyltransferase